MPKLTFRTASSIGASNNNGNAKILDRPSNIVPRIDVDPPVSNVLIDIENPQIPVISVAAYQRKVNKRNRPTDRRLIFSANVPDHLPPLAFGAEGA